MCDYCSWIQQILARINIEEKLVEERIPPPRVDPVIIVHGGAGKMTEKKCNFMIEEVKDAAIKGYDALILGYSAVDAIDISISRLEDTLYSNYKETPHIYDEIVMDAGIMTNDLDAGCVGAVRDIEHPIKLARVVLENTDHVLIVEKGAQKLARDANLPLLSQKYLSQYSSSDIDFDEAAEAGEAVDSDSTNGIDDSSSDDMMKDDDCKRQISMIKSYFSQCQFLDADPEMEEMEEEESEMSESNVLARESSNTVGAVAYDRKRHFATGISTMGKPFKIIGSISATGTVVGCGIYADEYGCCSLSGDSKEIYRYAPARRIVERMNSEKTTMLLVNEEIDKYKNATGESEIGVIALNANGEPLVSFRSFNFPWACCHNGIIYYGCKQDDRFCHEIQELSRPLDCMCDNAP